MSTKAASELPNRRVVLAVDGSEFTRRAFDWYTENLYREGDVVLLVHAFEMPVPAVFGFGASVAIGEGYQQQVQAAQDKAIAVLGEYTALCESKKISCQKIIEAQQDSAGEVVCRIAKEKQADMIMMGSRGQGMLRRTFLGSVSDYVIHHCHLPVTVVPPKK
ncbi:universal stress protein Slr1101-like isoform X2 [Corticium candelabrum]|uniref:universal stress protein Slr1101-like isoform X2 n=1 Tax=Corticium candelabrum TaxID=121492 RepID=UPI002E25AF93|nr:universal stress protein Slr1101-like isoform X2 [Corticium candelabrum]